MTTALSSLRRRVDPILLLILVAALILRLSWLAYLDAVPFSDARTYFVLADRLASGLGYVGDSGDPTAFQPIGYPATLAAFFSVFGSEVWAGELLNVICSLATVVLTYILGRQLYGLTAGRLAGALIAFMPSQIFVTSLLFSEPLHTTTQLAAVVLIVQALKVAAASTRAEDDIPALSPTVEGFAGVSFLLPHLDKWRLVGFLCAAVITGLALYLWRRREVPALLWAAAGFFAAYALLVRPAGILIVLSGLLMATVAARRLETQRAREPSRRFLERMRTPPVLHGAIFLVVTLMTLAPWVARNWSEINYGTTTSTNGGINLLVGNHHNATGCFSFDQEEHGYLFLISNEADRDRRALGEVLDFVISEPQEALALLPRKFDCTWGGDAISVYWNSVEQPDRPGETQRALFTIGSNYYYYSVLFLAFLGTPAWFRRDPRYLLAPLLVGLTAIYYTIILGDARYHEPLLPFFAVWAAVGILFIPRWWRLARTMRGTQGAPQ